MKAQAVNLIQQAMSNDLGSNNRKNNCAAEKLHNYRIFYYENHSIYGLILKSKSMKEVCKKFRIEFTGCILNVEKFDSRNDKGK